MASKLLSICLTDDVPMMTDVTRLSARSHASAICARVWLRLAAMSSSFFAASTRSFVTCDAFRNPDSFDARLPSGIPLLYFPVSMPCAKGEKQMIPLPLSAASWKFSLQYLRSNMEKRYWLSRHGTLASFNMSYASCCLSAGYFEIPTYSALPYELDECFHRLFYRGYSVVAVAIENIEIVEFASLEALVARCNDVLSRTAGTIDAVPHVMSSLGRNEHLVAMASEVATQYFSEIFLSTARRRPIVVCKVEMADSLVEGIENHVARRHEVVNPSEIVP